MLRTQKSKKSRLCLSDMLTRGWSVPGLFLKEIPALYMVSSPCSKPCEVSLTPRALAGTTKRDLRVWADGKLSRSQQHALTAQRASRALGCIGHSTASQLREGIVPFCTALVQPHLEHCMQLWAPQYKKDVKLLECIQRRATKMVKGLEGRLLRSG